MEKTTAKLYITSKQPVSINEIYFLVGSNLCYVNSIKKFSEKNYIINVEFRKYEYLLNLLQMKKTYYDKHIKINRVFKSMKLRGKWLEEPKQSFLIETIMNIEGLIKKKIDVRVIANNKSGEWGKALTQRWQKELDNNSFKERGIYPLVDITKEGTLKFHIVKSFDYIITFFEDNLDKLTEEK